MLAPYERPQGCGDRCYYKTPKVGNRGPFDSPFVIIGESPGAHEVVEGKPFVGPAGTVIDETLAKMGVERLTRKGILPLYMNAIKCLPSQKTAETLQAACQACHPHLIEELQAHPRKIILALGGPALQSLLGDYSLKITKERGKLFRSPLAQIGIVASVHPAFLLHGGGNYTQFERDVKYAIELMLEGESARKLPNGTRYAVAESLADVKDFASDLTKEPKGTQSASDIETTGFNYQTDRILYLGMQTKSNSSFIIPGKYIIPELFQSHISYTWHNGKFDCRFLRPRGIVDARVDDDTMLLSYCLNERRGIHDLDMAASDWLGSVNHKSMVSEFYKGFVIDTNTGLKRSRNLGDAPPELVERYLALDINDTYHLRDTLKPQVQNDRNLWRFYTQHLIPGSEYLLKLELNGMFVDQEWVLQNNRNYLVEIDKHEAQLISYAARWGLPTFNPRSWQQVKELLYTRMKLAPISWATDDDTLLKLPSNPVVKTLQAYRKAEKGHGTYVKPLLVDRSLIRIRSKGAKVKEAAVYPDGKTHSSYLLHGTPTSRLACRDINVQNIPRLPILRGMFKASRPTHCILEIDYSQAELRSLAALSKCRDLLEIFLSGKSLHDELSAFLFGENFTREDKMAAKTVNFGIPYGREASSIADDPDLNKVRNITVEEAQSWIDGWAQRFPGAWEFIMQCAMAPLRNQTVVTCFGNKKRPGVVSREKLHDLQNEFRNFPHQSIASNLTIRSGIELFDPLRRDYDTHIINTVHDCLVAEVPKDPQIIQATAKFICAKMEEIPQRFNALKIVPFVAEPEVGHHWGNLLKFNDVQTKYNWDIEAIPQYIAPH